MQALLPISLADSIGQSLRLDHTISSLMVPSHYLIANRRWYTRTSSLGNIQYNLL